MNPTPSEPVPPELRFLKWLVGLLAGVMILGIVAIVGLLIFRFGVAPSAMPPDLPERLELPQGARATAVTMGGDWIAVVTEDEILIFDAGSGALRQRIGIE
jgi:hypothetical protein